MNKKIMIGVMLAALICMTMPAMAEPTPFVITGHVYGFCGNPCNGSYLRVTNLNTSEGGCPELIRIEILPAHVVQ
ncbi:MAG: hypothetical protein EMLJLAPB_00600 [Candidatus Argoarchaeum ethanivorans]|uniref:Uncharacterized protein n=1 Tax=Candidatus Argoarchaeum ethanivorans TaxID=2608793 RepID=A0A811TD89_9EURY|nr:MAG: hypothetical protein EMLJLAPB_00600 [Candidatus Argoarchaeum ethanivorans]